MHTFTYVYVYTYMCTHKYTHTHIHMQTMYAHIYIHIHIRTFAYIYIRTHSSTYTHICTHLYVNLTCMYAYIHICHMPYQNTMYFFDQLADSRYPTYIIMQLLCVTQVTQSVCITLLTCRYELYALPNLYMHYRVGLSI